MPWESLFRRRRGFRDPYLGETDEHPHWSAVDGHGYAVVGLVNLALTLSDERRELFEQGEGILAHVRLEMLNGRAAPLLIGVFLCKLLLSNFEHGGHGIF